uniref:Hydrogenase maturation factor HypA n=1 Tax=candidate division WOR-3 bacterium TaxID=2052148 RepID=A0A7C6EDZ0_UNCW3
MHELAITESILNQCLNEAKKHQAKTIKKINLLIGAATSIVPDCVQFYFDILKQKTIARDAILVIKTVPLVLRCSKCKTECKDLALPCDCDAGIEIVSGQELLIESLEIE